MIVNVENINVSWSRTTWYNKTCLKRPLKMKTKLVFKIDYRLMQVERVAECSKGSILQYFRPSISYNLSLISLFCLFLSGHLRQVLLYITSYTFYTRKCPLNVF